MPIHDWTRVADQTFNAFQHLWIGAIGGALNAGILPPEYYGYPEQVAGDVPQGGPTTGLARAYDRRRQTGVVVRHSNGNRMIAVIDVIAPGYKASPDAVRAFVERARAALDRGVHLLVLDLLPTPRGPQGIHGALFEDLESADYKAPPDKPLSLAAYAAGGPTRAWVEHVAVGDPWPDMPLFLGPEHYVNVPLAATYDAALLGMARTHRRLLEAP